MGESVVEVRYGYDVQALDRTVRQTNNLLRFVNAIRHAVIDLQQVFKKPTLANVFWTLINFIRVYTSLKRLLKSISYKSTKLLLGLGQRTRVGGGPWFDTPETVAHAFTRGMMGFPELSVNFEAYANFNPIPVERLDLTNVPQGTITLMQRILEQDAPQNVEDAQRLLRERIMYPEESTGRLESSITWFTSFPGTTVTATAPYAFWVESGQRSFTGHHFLRDSAGIASIRISNRAREEIEKLLA